MAKVLIPLAHGFEEIEALAVVDILRRADIGVTLAGLLPGPVLSAHNISINPDTTVDAASAGTFDVIVLPGGQPGTDNLNADPRIHELLRQFASEHKLIGAICAAPIVLAASGLLKGKRVTCYPSYHDRLSGGIYENTPVVSDGTLITSQGAGTAISFALALVSRLVGRGTADRVAKAMLV
ncbi:MAG: DJ-1/PfpI family protein [Desulfuromonadaceae bacterium]|nr:DJ-1/PfpI family protein [Desulfuromonadaceae bacterium]MDD5106203.1 DJ-1/PfpI family protein [Desulfuromonadaceae bacterium]